jgi:hypothetical protein
VRDLLGLSDADYAKVLSKFEHRAGFDGIYRTTKKNMEKFAVVVEMPRGMSLDSKLVTGGLAGLAGLSALAATGLGVGFRKRGKELEKLQDVNSSLITRHEELVNLKRKQAEAPSLEDGKAKPNFLKKLFKKEEELAAEDVSARIAQVEAGIKRAQKSRLDEIEALRQIYKAGQDNDQIYKVYKDAYNTLERLNGYINSLEDTRIDSLEKQLSLPLIIQFVEQAYQWMNIKASTPDITETTRDGVLSKIRPLGEVLTLINSKPGETENYGTREDLQAAIKGIIEAALSK